MSEDSPAPPSSSEWVSDDICDTYNRWYHMFKYTYESLFVYPKNIVSTFPGSEPFISANIKVFDECGEESVSFSGWHQVKDGERVTVAKYVDKPTLTTYD